MCVNWKRPPASDPLTFVMLSRVVRERVRAGNKSSALHSNEADENGARARIRVCERPISFESILFRLHLLFFPPIE